MALDRAAWESKYRQGADSRQASTRAAQALQRLRQAAVPLERLTGSEHWDTYLRLVEHMQEADLAAVAEVHQRLGVSHWLAPSEVAKLRHALAVLQTRISTRAELTELPRSILRDLQQVSEDNPEQ